MNAANADVLFKANKGELSENGNEDHVILQ